MKKICIKLFLTYIMLQMFVSGSGANETRIVKKYTNAEFIRSYINLSDANNKESSLGTKNPEFDTIHLSTTQDIDKYRLLRSYASDELRGISPFEKRNVVSSTELESIVKNSPPPTVMHLPESSAVEEADEYSDYLDDLLCRGLSPDSAFSNDYYKIIYGENYFLTVTRSEGVETVSVYSDRYRHTKQFTDENCEDLAKKLLGRRFIKTGPTDLAHSAEVIFQSRTNASETLLAEYVPDRGIIYLCFKKKADLS